MAERSILEKYDEAIATYFADTYATMYPTLDVQVLVATPDRQFADFVTKKFVEADLFRVPRIQIYRGGFMHDPSRHNPNNIRRFLPGTDCRSYQSVRFPTAANISYQIGFWTDKQHQMNRWDAKALFDFHSGYSPQYFSVTVGDGWGDKIFPVWLERIDNNSDLEPDEGPRAIRHDLTLRMAAWIFDQPGIEPGAPALPGTNVPAVLEVEATACDQDTDEELFTAFEPKGGL
jgi:hypothetical protein